MADYLEGFLGTQQAGIEARNDVTVFIRNWYANLNPLVTRLAYVPVERVDFITYQHKYRTQSVTLGAAISSNSATTLTVSDSTSLMNHDVLQVIDSSTGNYEFVQLSSDPPSGTTINVTRNVVTDGSTLNAAALSSAANGSAVWQMGNSRTGAEINQSAITTIGTPFTQYCQTYQFPVDIGGSAQTARAQVFPGGIQTPADFNMTMSLQNLVNDVERTFYYGVGQSPNDVSGVTAKAFGLKNILKTNNISAVTGTTPANAAAYGSSDLLRDTLFAARNGGGDPDVLLVSVNFMQGFSIWGEAIERIPAGETELGVSIKTLNAPFLQGVSIVECPLLRPYTAIALTSQEVYVRSKRNPFYQPRGVLGDRVQADWIAEMALNVMNESHHAYVEGITAFSAS